jgi:hypothetical protein
MVLTIARGPGDLSKAGVLKKKNPFFGLTLHPDDGKEIKRRLLNEDETLDPEKKLPFKEAILTIAEFLETKAEVFYLDCIFRKLKDKKDCKKESQGNTL